VPETATTCSAIRSWSALIFAFDVLVVFALTARWAARGACAGGAGWCEHHEHALARAIGRGSGRPENHAMSAAAERRPASAAASGTAPLEERAGGDGRQPQRFALLLCSVVASVAVLGTVASGALQQVVVSSLLAASLVLSFRIARVSRPLMILAVAVAVAGVGVSVVQAANGGIGDGAARAMNALLVSLGPPAVGLGVVRNLRAHQEVRLEAVMGVLSLYMLLGLLFAFVYGAMDRLGGDPFFDESQQATVANCVYFSFTTLTTAGFGDFTARTDLGHTLTVFEALVGQIYLVTVVSLIVSNLGRRNSPR
jgi:hypothetical protein